MSVYKKFPLALAACFALCLMSTAAAAQNDAARPRQVAPVTQPNGESRLENDFFVVSEAAEAAPAPVEIARPSLLKPLRPLQFNHLIMTAIERRLGAPYVLGTEGPYRFDCSGFVWSVFQDAGVQFERGSARHFWEQFEPVDGAERYKFGTLVFFNRLGHVGIVADEHGFYHASSSKGVTYSAFNDYWTSRITGFRRIPVALATAAE